MADVTPPPGGDALARELHTARARLAAADLAPQERARLQRKFIAVCDAAKVPGADSAACLKRLESFLAALDNAIAKNSRYND
jgi:hypothetical protein